MKDIISYYLIQNKNQPYLWYEKHIVN